MKITVQQAESLAYIFRANNNLSSSEPIHVKTLLRKCNILTVYLPMSEQADGLSLISPSKDRFILVNSNAARGRQHFTIAHELYHLYFDENPRPHICNIEGKTIPEQNANLFASALLMPQDAIYSMLDTHHIKGGDIHISLILKMEQYFGVSRYALLLRLKKIGVINEATLKKLQVVPVIQSAQEYGYDLSLYNPGNANLVIGDYGEKARLLFEQGKISEGHYIELLNCLTNGKD